LFSLTKRIYSRARTRERYATSSPFRTVRTAEETSPHVLILPLARDCIDLKHNVPSRDDDGWDASTDDGPRDGNDGFGGVQSEINAGLVWKGFVGLVGESYFILT